MVERSSIPNEFHYVAAGHVHRHQQLISAHANGPGVIYCGSPDRISFAEASEPKGWVLIHEEGDGLSATFTRHDVRPMTVCPMDVSGLSTRQIRDRLAETLATLPPGAVAQLRVTGRTTRSALSGIRFAATARALRPDVLLSASVTELDFAPGGAVISRPDKPKSVFVGLNLARPSIVGATVTKLDSLPTGCGVYAMYDAEHRPLYIGKSKKVRARVRTHLRGTGGVNFFQGWAVQVAWIDVLRTDSELEALLVEAELVRRVGPPFNRRMRRWQDYRYVVQNGAAYGQLEVSGDSATHHRCFGPFRSRGQADAVCQAVADHFELARCPDDPPPSRPMPLFRAMSTALVCERYHRGLCPGPCTATGHDTDYERSIHRRNEFLAGQDAASLRDLEIRLQSMEDLLGEPARHSVLWRRAATLRTAFDHTSALRKAKTHLNGLLIMPGPDGRRRTAIPTSRGMRFGLLKNTVEDANRVLREHARIIRNGVGSSVGVLPRSSVDALCIVIRQLKHRARICKTSEPHASACAASSARGCSSMANAPTGGDEGHYQFVPHLTMKALEARSLLALAFAPD